MAASLCASMDSICTLACAPGAGRAAVTTKSVQVREDILCEQRGKNEYVSKYIRE